MIRAIRYCEDRPHQLKCWLLLMRLPTSMTAKLSSDIQRYLISRLMLSLIAEI